MYRDIAAAGLWFAVFWTFGSYAEAYLGIYEIVGFALGLIVALGIVTRAIVRQRRLATATPASLGTASPEVARAPQVDVGPVAHV